MMLTPKEIQVFRELTKIDTENSMDDDYGPWNDTEDNWYDPDDNHILIIDPKECIRSENARTVIYTTFVSKTIIERLSESFYKEIRLIGMMNGVEIQSILQRRKLELNKTNEIKKACYSAIVNAQRVEVNIVAIE